MLKLLAPCSVALVAGSTCGLLLSSCSKTSKFTSVEDIDKYISKHQKIHEDVKPWATKTSDDKEMLGWLWDRKNFGLQNMINSGLTLAKDSFFGESAKDQGITDVKITLKTSNKSAKIDIQFNETNSDDNSVIAAETLFDVKNFKDKSFDYESSSMDNTNNCWVSQHYHITSWSSYASNFTLRGNCGNGEFGSDTWTPFYPLPTEYPGCSFPNY